LILTTGGVNIKELKDNSVMANKKDLFKQSLTQKKVLKKAAPDVQSSERIIKEVHTEEVSSSPTPAAKAPQEKEAVQRVTIDFPVSVYTALKYASFEKRVTLKKYIVELVRKDLNLEE
jgi:hypothetical protein